MRLKRNVRHVLNFISSCGEQVVRNCLRHRCCVKKLGMNILDPYRAASLALALHDSFERIFHHLLIENLDIVLHYFESREK